MFIFTLFLCVLERSEIFQTVTDYHDGNLAFMNILSTAEYHSLPKDDEIDSYEN